MNPFSKISKNLFSIFQTVLIVLLVVLVVVFVGVLSFESVEKHTSELLDLPSKNEILKFLGIGMGGVLVALQALMSYKRAKAKQPRHHRLLHQRRSRKMDRRVQKSRARNPKGR